MTAPVPQPRYYDTGTSRRSFLLGAGAALLVGGATAGLALGTDVFDGVLNDLFGGNDGSGAKNSGDGSSVEPDSGGGGGGNGVVEGADKTPGANTGGNGSSGARPTSMAMVGDSITARSKNALVFTLTAMGFDGITINGLTSRRIEIGDGSAAPLSGIKSMYQMLAFGVKPEVWVIALGTNDVGQYSGAEDYTRLIDAMASMLPVEMPLVWVDVYRPEYLDASRLFNQLLGEYMDKRGNAVVAHWYDLAAAPDQNILQHDHIHPNDRGTAVFASLVNDAIATFTTP